jgi:uncharacterized protein
MYLENPVLKAGFSRQPGSPPPPPELFKVLRVLMDRDAAPAKFLLLGSASPGLLRQSQSSESLAGRVEVIEIGGFALEEAGPEALGVLNGQVWNAADPARSLGVNESTVRRHLDWLTQTFMVRQLQPWFENLAKRQVKSPKIYFRDSGLLHALLGIADEPALLAHPRSGASWEAFALEQTLELAAPDEAWFWATHAGAELDLLMVKNGRRVGVEFKRMDAPRLTPSMRTAMRDLRLEALYVVYPGERRYSLAESIEAVPLKEAIGGQKSS